MAQNSTICSLFFFPCNPGVDRDCSPTLQTSKLRLGKGECLSQSLGAQWKNWSRHPGQLPAVSPALHLRRRLKWECGSLTGKAFQGGAHSRTEGAVRFLGWREGRVQRSSPDIHAFQLHMTVLAHTCSSSGYQAQTEAGSITLSLQMRKARLRTGSVLSCYSAVRGGGKM